MQRYAFFLMSGFLFHIFLLLAAKSLPWHTSCPCGCPAQRGEGSQDRGRMAHQGAHDTSRGARRDFCPTAIVSLSSSRREKPCRRKRKPCRRKRKPCRKKRKPCGIGASPISCGHTVTASDNFVGIFQNFDEVFNNFDGVIHNFDEIIGRGQPYPYVRAASGAARWAQGKRRTTSGAGVIATRALARGNAHFSPCSLQYRVVSGDANGIFGHNRNKNAFLQHK